MWNVNQRVWAQKNSEDVWYAAIVRHIDGERCYVIFDDGEDALIDNDKLKALELHAGDRLFARLPMDAEFKPATVVSWDDEKVQVRWPDGEDWTSYGMIRLQPQTDVKMMDQASMLSEGQPVFACWHDLYWYPGVLLKVDGVGHHVGFDDGSQVIVAPDRIKPLELGEGDHVFCRWQGGPQFYPGEISHRKDEVIKVRYEDGDEETTTIRLVRLQRDDWLPPAEMADLSIGDRVLACWQDSNWYPGSVLAVDGKRLHILFDDGDQGMLTPGQVRALDINVGDRVWCRYKGGPKYFSGEVLTKEGEVIHVRYDDGDEETTLLRLIRIMGDNSGDMA